MKPIQVMFDEDLLRRLDADPNVRRRGRSAVLRRATADYLQRSRRQGIADGYRRAYGAAPGLGEEFAGWANQGSWPES